MQQILWMRTQITSVSLDQMKLKSNRLQEVFTRTSRQWLGRMKPDYDEALSPAGRVIDSQLSEHQAEGMLEDMS